MTTAKSGHHELRDRVDGLLSDAGGPWSAVAADELSTVCRALADELERELETTVLSADTRELLRLTRQLTEEGTVAWVRAVADVQSAIGRLGEAGPVSEILERAVAEVAQGVDLDRVVLSRINDGCLLAEGAHCRDGAGEGAALLARLRRDPVRLEYPLAEAEMLRRRRPQLIDAGAEHGRGLYAFEEPMQWGAYVATPIVLESRVIGFLHGDRLLSRRPLRELDREALWRFAEAFAGIFERAVLRRRLRIQRQELRQVASWADTRTSELSDGAIDLAADQYAMQADEPARAGPRNAEIDSLLTKRELDVFELMAKGETNAAIARALVVSEGTVKFHVKNILRKLNASNRAEATSTYLRVALREPDGVGRRTPWGGLTPSQVPPIG